MTITNNGTLLPSFAGSETGVSRVISPGTYSVAESAGSSGYMASLSADCSGTIAASEQKTCTITNDDQPAHLTVIKHVINDNGGTKSAADFTITVTSNGATLPSFAGSETGTALSLNAGAYSADEAPAAGYTKTNVS